MDVAEVKLDLIQWLTQIQDESLLMKIQLLKEDQSKSLEISPEQLLELDRRLEKYEAGEMEFSIFEEVKERIRNRSKNDI